MFSDIENLYQKLVEAGFSEEEIQRRVKEKTDKFQGFMSQKAILFLIAKESGLNFRSSDIDSDIYGELQDAIDYDEFAINISDVKKGMRNIVILGRIERIFGTKNFYRKDGTPGTVGSFLIKNGSGHIKIVLWGEHVKVMESDYFQTNELIRIIGGYSKGGLNGLIEIHLGKRGKIILAPKDVDLKKIPSLNNDLDNKYNLTLKIRDLLRKEGFIKKINGVIFKIEEFKEIDLKNGGITFLLKFILSDDTSSIRVIVWGLNAVNCFKIINEGDKIELSNVLIKFNMYTNEKEISFVKNSKLIKI